ncbi:Permease, cytosine/purine, uracil, thiamine, allantoin family [Escherichia coli]|nr:Permease, cytosine/purine, uracil, thiamine, allantoin family [Escherichia coli]
MNNQPVFYIDQIRHFFGSEFTGKIHPNKILINTSYPKLTAIKIINYHSIFNIVLQGNDSNLLIVFYVQIMPDDFVMQLHRF